MNDDPIDRVVACCGGSCWTRRRQTGGSLFLGWEKERNARRVRTGNSVRLGAATFAKTACWILVLAGCFCLSLSQLDAAAPGEATGFESLFDGQTLDGWRKVGGGATYAVEQGCIVGRVGPGPNTFLRTAQSYRNFTFRAQVKLDVPGNSGIQFRSHQRNGEGRVYGYQAEIDPSPRGWSGGIYDEGRRGWLYSLQDDPQARTAFHRDGWNQYEIRAIGPWLRTWVNGVLCADLIDTMDDEGFVALQVHSGQAGQIRWREIQLKPLADTPWQPLWNGEDLAGWEAIGGGQWTIEDQEGPVIHGVSQASESRHGHLITTREYTDFAVRLKYKAIKGNSGLYFRVAQGGGAGVLGFQAEIDPQHDVGGLYETGGRAWVVQPSAEEVARWFRPGEWNSMTVVALGPRIVVQVNGKTSAQLLQDPGRRKGQIALQLHGGQEMDVLFKDIELMSLESLPEE